MKVSDTLDNFHRYHFSKLYEFLCYKCFDISHPFLLYKMYIFHTLHFKQYKMYRLDNSLRHIFSFCSQVCKMADKALCCRNYNTTLHLCQQVYCILCYKHKPLWQCSYILMNLSHYNYINCKTLECLQSRHIAWNNTSHWVCSQGLVRLQSKAEQIQITAKWWLLIDI